MYLSKTEWIEYYILCFLVSIVDHIQHTTRSSHHAPRRGRGILSFSSSTIVHHTHGPRQQFHGTHQPSILNISTIFQVTSQNQPQRKCIDWFKNESSISVGIPLNIVTAPRLVLPDHLVCCPESPSSYYTASFQHHSTSNIVPDCYSHRYQRWRLLVCAAWCRRIVLY